MKIEWKHLQAGKDYSVELYKNKLELIKDIDEAYEKLNNYYNSTDDGTVKWSLKKCNALIKNVNDLIIELNKANNIYYHEDKWIYDIAKEIDTKDLTGNALVELVAKELNKLDGVIVRIYNVEDGTVNADISVVTPYKIYYYSILRGYAKQFKITKGTTSSTVTRLVKRHIVDLMFGECFKDKKEEGCWWYDDYLEKK